MREIKFGPCGLDDYIISKEKPATSPDELCINGHYPLMLSFIEATDGEEGVVLPSIIKWAARVDPEFTLVNALAFDPAFRFRQGLMARIDNEGLWTPAPDQSVPFARAPVLEAHFGERITSPLDMGIRAILNDARVEPPPVEL